MKFLKILLKFAGILLLQESGISYKLYIGVLVSAASLLLIAVAVTCLITFKRRAETVTILLRGGSNCQNTALPLNIRGPARVLHATGTSHLSQSVTNLASPTELKSILRSSQSMSVLNSKDSSQHAQNKNTDSPLFLNENVAYADSNRSEVKSYHEYEQLDTLQQPTSPHSVEIVK